MSESKHLWSRARLIIATMVLAGGILRAAELPSFVGVAFARFNPDPPAGWAFTVAVTRGTENVVESFDPSRPGGHRWVLEKVNGHAPSDKDADQYARYRETMDTAGSARATFARGDVDWGAVHDVSTKDATTTFTCAFRSGAAEPVLAHLNLKLEAAAGPARILRSTLRLVSPYSPIFGVTMKSLSVETTYATPTGESVEMPSVRVSRFLGRVLWLWPIEEMVETRYSGYHRVGAHEARP